MQTKINDAIRLLGSRWTFWAGMLVFTLEAGWLSLTSRFPMAFDEAYHLGLIRYFSHHLNPVITSQPPSTYKFGALVQNSSFLYHYLMSFPYRLIAFMTDSPVAQVICLRLINVALAVATFIVLRKMLRFMRVSDPLSNVIILVFALTPIMTVLSAQISYDNLLILAVSSCVYVMMRFLRRLGNGNFDAALFLALLSLSLLSSLIKFAFLPVLLAISISVLWRLISRWTLDRAGIIASAKSSFRAVNRYIKVLLVAATLVSMFLFTRFYVVNLVRYHNPVPQCNQVLDINACSKYYAWDGNNLAKRYYAAHPAEHKMNVFEYTGYWLLVNTFGLFGVIAPFYGLYDMSLPFVVITGSVGAAGFICLAVNFRQLRRRHPEVAALSVISVTYVLFLWGRNYHDYLQLGRPAALSARYLLPVLPYVYVLMALGLHAALRRYKSWAAMALKTGSAYLLVLIFLCFGGFRQYIYQIDSIYGRLGPSNEFNLKYPFDNPWKAKD